MGVIKGSEQALVKDAGKKYLTREEYSTLSARSQATFASRRREIYTLFEAYLKSKRNLGDYDAADRTHAILQAMKEMGAMGKKLDFLCVILVHGLCCDPCDIDILRYVDEVQDNLLIDTLRT